MIDKSVESDTYVITIPPNIGLWPLFCGVLLVCHYRELYTSKPLATQA